MSSGKRWGGWGLAVGLLGAACSRANPVFDQDGSGGQTGGSDTGTVGDGTVTTGRPGDGTIGEGSVDGGSVDGGSVDGGSVDGGSEGPTVCGSDEECANDEFCDGAEICDPSHDDANDFGCLPPSEPRCPDGAECLEAQKDCVTNCDMGDDADSDGAVAAECGGIDCDDFQPNIIEAGSDWAHCEACNQPCDTLQACQAGACIDARRVFVSSWVQAGDMGSLDAADDICQGLADGEGLGGAFEAYIRDAGTTLESRLEHAMVPYVRLDGVRIADNWMDLTDGSLQAPLFVDEHRDIHMEPEERAWTGLVPEGSMFEGDCGGWMNAFEGSGAAGEVAAMGPNWRGVMFPTPCSFELRLYCIEQDGGGG